MPTPYETLGVRPNASKRTIQKSYRKKSMASHPDRGGDAAEFHAVQKAYELLMDDARRARYDATGDASEQAVDNSLAESMSILSQNLAKVIQQSMMTGQKPKHRDLIAEIRKNIQGRQQELRDGIKKFDGPRAMLKELLGRFDVDGGGENFMESVVRSHIAEFEGPIKKSEAEMEANERALELLAKFRFRREEIKTLAEMNGSLTGGKPRFTFEDMVAAMGMGKKTP